MIHVAPCSCELHQALREALERNRAYEAVLKEAFDKIRELEEWKRVHIGTDPEEVQALHAAREREAELEHSNSLRETLWTQRDYQQARAEKAEARVAELEQQLALANTMDGLEPDEPEREAD